MSPRKLTFFTISNSVDIFFRFSPDVDLWNSSGKWKRIIPNINKETLIKVSLVSLKNSILNFLENNDLVRELRDGS